MKSRWHWVKVAICVLVVLLSRSAKAQVRCDLESKFEAGGETLTNLEGKAVAQKPGRRQAPAVVGELLDVVVVRR